MPLTNAPQDPKSWADYLTRQQLPATIPVGELLHEKISESSASYGELAALVNRDPVTSCLVMCRANQSARDEGSSTVEHAISRIGVNTLDNIALTLSVVDLSDPRGAGVHYVRSLSTSLLAASIGAHMAGARKPEIVSSVYWATLISNLPHWLMWYFAADMMRIIEHEARLPGRNRLMAEYASLGCSLAEISREVLTRLKPHPLALRLSDPQHLPSARQLVAYSRLAREKGTPPRPDDRELALLSSDPTFVAYAANRLAEAGRADWYSRTTLRWLKVCSAWAGLTLPDFIATVHRLAVDVARDHPFRGIMSPAARLLLPPQERRIRVRPDADARPKPEAAVAPRIPERPLAKPAATPPQVFSDDTDAFTFDDDIPASAAQPSPATVDAKPAAPRPQLKPEPAGNDEMQRVRQGSNRQLFDEMTRLMLKQPYHFSDLHELMNAAVQCLCYGLGLKNVTAALVNAQQTRMRAYYSAGVASGSRISQFDTDLTKPSLLTRFMEKPASIWMKPSSTAATWNALPAAFRDIAHAKEFFLTSVFAGPKPVALFYADGGDIPCTENEYKQFKYLCAAVSQCLLNIAERRKAESRA